MKILLVSYGSTGDVRPFLALGKVLREQGQAVRVCAPPDSAGLLREADLPFTPLGSSVRDLMDARAGQMVGRPLAALAPMTRVLHRELATQFQQLPEHVAQADLVVGAGLALSVPSLAEVYAKPYRYAFGIPALLPSRFHAPIMLPWQNLPAPCNVFLWQLAATMLDISYRPLLNRFRRRLGIPPLGRVMPHLTRNLIVAADKELAPLPPEAPKDCRQTGYWHADRADALSPVIEDFLKDGPPPVYIGFGSMGDATPWKTIALLRHAVEIAGVRAIIQGGWARLDFESDATCLCVNGDLPHDRLFARVAVAVHHGGAGTVMAAARAGIPQVIVPHILDQYYWGQRIRQLHIGPSPIPKNRLSAERLARAIRQVLASPDIPANAKTLAGPLQGRDGAREAAKWITACA